MMRVLIVHHQMAVFGGAELVVVRLAHYLQRQGHQVSILAASTACHPEYTDLDIITPTKEVSWHLWDGALGSLHEIYRVFMVLRKFCREHAANFDVINTHNFPAIWAVPRHRRVVWMCNEVPDLWHRATNGGPINKVLDLGRLGDRVIARSKSPRVVVPDSLSAQRFYHRYKLMPSIIPYGIDGDFFSQIDPEHHPRTDDFTILQPSMVSPSKNQLAVLEAANSLKQTIPNLRVVLAGYREQNQYTALLSKYISEHSLNAAFTDMATKEELLNLYSEAHVAIFPGRGQGSWLGPFEALAASCPIIVSPNLSCSSTVGNLGTISDNLTESITNIYKNYATSKRQALKGREFVLNSLTWDRFGEKFLKVLKSA